MQRGRLRRRLRPLGLHLHGRRGLLLPRRRDLRVGLGDLGIRGVEVRLGGLDLGDGIVERLLRGRALPDQIRDPGLGRLRVLQLRAGLDHPGLGVLDLGLGVDQLRMGGGDRHHRGLNAGLRGQRRGVRLDQLGVELGVVDHRHQLAGLHGVPGPDRHRLQVAGGLRVEDGGPERGDVGRQRECERNRDALGMRHPHERRRRSPAFGRGGRGRVGAGRFAGRDGGRAAPEGQTQPQGRNDRRDPDPGTARHKRPPIPSGAGNAPAGGAAASLRISLTCRSSCR